VSVLSDDLRTLSYEAALYFYPLVLMDITRLQALNAPADSPFGGTPNQFHHVRTFPSADFRAVVRPNFDTLYSSAWLDFTGGPVIVHAPDSDDRYYMLPMLDMWSDVFANPGKRTTGTAAQDFVVAPTGFTGELPADLPVIWTPTPHVWIIGRTQTNGPPDYPNVHKIQDGLGITTLSPTSQPAPEGALPPGFDATTEPLRLVNGMEPLDFFAYAADLLAVNPPHPTDFSVLARLTGLGIAAGKSFRPSDFDPQQRGEIAAGWAAAVHDVAASLAGIGTRANGWLIIKDNIGVYGNAYKQRALVALVGLGANPPEDAVYPMLEADADGDPIMGERDYVLHFDADNLPPATAFWSVTMYDGEGYQVANEIDRFAIGDRDKLAFNADGSLDIYVQRTNPGPERASNWLPAPGGPLGVTMRLYAPKPPVLDGSWSPPPVRKAQVGA
jgi:hypothetical protein